MNHQKLSAFWVSNHSSNADQPIAPYAAKQGAARGMFFAMIAVVPWSLIAVALYHYFH